MAKFSKDSLMKDVLESLIKKSGCGLDAKRIPFFREVVEETPSITFDECIDYLKDDADGNFDAYFCLRVLDDELNNYLRIKLIKKITQPMRAFMLYKGLSSLTDEEDKLLEAKFKDKLPQAEKELETGIVSRAKGM